MTTIADKLNQIIQIKLQLEQVLASENVTTDGSFEDVVNKIQELEVGDALMLNDFIQGDVETFSSNVTTLRAYSLCGMKSTKIFLPEVTTANMYSLTTCPNLDYVYVPKLETVSNYTFSHCTKLGATYDIEFPNVTSIILAKNIPIHVPIIFIIPSFLYFLLDKTRKKLYFFLYPSSKLTTISLLSGVPSATL